LFQARSWIVLVKCFFLFQPSGLISLSKGMNCSNVLDP
jgi:hypothetical protein